MEHYFELITDPAHTAVEMTYIMVDLLILSWVKGRVVKHFHRDLARRDKQHGH